MKLRPLGNRILVKRKAAEEKIGLIFVPDAAKEPPSEGKIVAVGPGKTLDDGTVRAMALNVGDQVLFSKYAGHEVKVGKKGEEETLVMITDDDVVGVLEEEDEG